LAVFYAAVECLSGHLKFLIKVTYNWFSHSALRQANYREIYSAINEASLPLKLLQRSQTRWLSIADAVCRIAQQWVELK
jgi:hypothetical protein